MTDPVKTARPYLLPDQSSLGARMHFAALGLARAALSPFGHRGLGVLCRQAGRLFGASAPMIGVELSTGGRFAMPIYDLSWQSYLYRGRPYEPEIETILHRLADVELDWLDCGANFGYWSAWLAGQRARMAGRIVAVEPSPSCLPVLRHTVALNGDRINLVEKAMHSTAGQTIPFVISRFHVASHVLEEGEEADGEVVHVPTVSLDALAEEFGLGGRPVIVKLDVEGQETNTIDGAGRLADADVLYLYEDHGKDRESQTSAHLLERGFSLFALDDDGQRPMSRVEEINAFKVRPQKGYNFGATTSAFWRDFLGG